MENERACRIDLFARAAPSHLFIPQLDSRENPKDTIQLNQVSLVDALFPRLLELFCVCVCVCVCGTLNHQYSTVDFLSAGY